MKCTTETQRHREEKKNEVHHRDTENTEKSSLSVRVDQSGKGRFRLPAMNPTHSFSAISAVNLPFPGNSISVSAVTWNRAGRPGSATDDRTALACPGLRSGVGLHPVRWLAEIVPHRPRARAATAKEPPQGAVMKWIPTTVPRGDRGIGTIVIQIGAFWERGLDNAPCRWWNAFRPPGKAMEIE